MAHVALRWTRGWKVGGRTVWGFELGVSFGGWCDMGCNEGVGTVHEGGQNRGELFAFDIPM